MCAFRISPSRATCSDHSDLPDSFNDAVSLQISPRAKVAAWLVGLPHVNWPHTFVWEKAGWNYAYGLLQGVDWVAANTLVSSQTIFNQGTGATSIPQFVDESWTASCRTAVPNSLRELRQMSYLTTLLVVKIT